MIAFVVSVIAPSGSRHASNDSTIDSSAGSAVRRADGAERRGRRAWSKAGRPARNRAESWMPCADARLRRGRCLFIGRL
jgi:hypothetical protein